MTHKEVYEIFKKLFPSQINFVSEVFPNGANSIRIRKKDDDDFVFTYNAENDFSLQSLESYINSL